ncbi:MAG: hypothetical protein IT539_14435 [Bradyrhizobiaceae bacterium]|nr:hypothetical protein [Bradyrhizobiaceae bacterium]
MGNPLHYSLELPQRCLQLIEELWPHVERIRQREHPELGALTTTFLISMSMPIINLPIERLERHRDARSEGYADDRHIDPRIMEAVTTVLSNQALQKAPFYSPKAWSFVAYTNRPLFNIANPIPDDLALELDTDEATARAARMPTLQWCSILRNAMAHGGIVYLDDEGRASYGRPVKMYAFVSGKFADSDREEVKGLNVLRISQANYHDFLRKWVAWLKSSGVDELAA